MLEPCFPIARSDALNGAGVPGFKGDVEVLLNQQRAVAVEQKISDENTGREANEDLNNVVVVGPI